MNFKYISYAFLFLLVLGSVSFAQAVGGNQIYDITENGTNYRIHVFTSNGTFNLSSTLNASVLVIGEGGGGTTNIWNGITCEDSYGGGGAGGYRYLQNLTIPTGSYNITMQRNAANYTSAGCDAGNPSPGGDTTFWNITATGGGHGHGGRDYLSASTGGSGGGGYYNGAVPAPGNVPATTPQQGWNGGWVGGGNNNGAGGGACGNASGNTAGIGCVNDINGSNVTYATGGTAFPYPYLSTPTNYGDGNGGAGVVIIRYVMPVPELSPAILNATNGSFFLANSTLYFVSNLSDPAESTWNISYEIFRNGTSYQNGTASDIVATVASTQINLTTISSGLVQNQNWGLRVNATNGTDNISTAIATNITIINSLPEITSLNFTANGSSYQLGSVQLNFSAQDLDGGNLTYFVNWFKNGTNITAYAQTGTMANGSTVSVSPNTTTFNVSDNWYARVWVSDGTSISAYNNTHNTTIQNYFSSVVAYAPNATSNVYTQAYINFTVAGAPTASARFTLGAQNVSMANSGTGDNYEFYNTVIVPPSVSEQTDYEGVWYYRAILANGSYYELTTNQSITVGINGFFICNSTLNTTAIEYTILDSFTLLPVNASVSLLTEWEGDDGSTVTKSLSDTNETVYICVTPETFNRQAIISESITATGYLPSVTFRPLQNYSSNVTERIIYLTNSSSGSVYTFQTLSQFSSPIPGATVTVMQGSTTIFTGTTDETGSVLVPLTQLSIYQVAASAAGYMNTSFNFVAGATTTIPITLLSTSAQNVTAPNYQAVFDEVQFTITPALRFFTSPQNITYTTSSPNGSLESWGWIITSNSTVINTQTSTTATGGSIVYLVNQTGTYFVNIWFKAAGFANYTPPAYVFTYGNNSGVYSAGQTLQTGSVISGFGYYLLAVVLAMMGALWVSQYSPEGAAIVGLLILCAFTFMWSDAVVVELGVDSEGQPNGITALMATGFVLLLTMSAFYLRQYGA